ncbi:hypothetical protein ACAW63_06240 [Pseudomonas sp. QE6]|uniref:hypothetical protein n=1 Tax=Pseudomonas sp. QE6 TaxID=3242491 RepID=UPI00352863AF
MSAIELLALAQANGVLLLLVDGKLTWEADHEPDADLLTLLAARKPEIIDALNLANTPPQQGWEWLTRLASLLDCAPADLLDRGFVDHHDLAEQHQLHPRFAAKLIRSHPQWCQPIAPSEQQTPEHGESSEPQHAHHTAATASQAWLTARDAFHAHALGGCPHCYPSLGRYCVTGAELRARYDSTAWS